MVSANATARRSSCASRQRSDSSRSLSLTAVSLRQTKQASTHKQTTRIAHWCNIHTFTLTWWTYMMLETRSTVASMQNKQQESHTGATYIHVDLVDMLVETRSTTVASMQDKYFEFNNN